MVYGRIWETKEQEVVFVGTYEAFNVEGVEDILKPNHDGWIFKRKGLRTPFPEEREGVDWRMLE